MDALSHALIAYLLFSSPPLVPLVPFAVLGAVLPDADIFLSLVADRNPSLYLFSHGGIAHSVAGAFFMSALSYGAAVVLAEAGFLPQEPFLATGVYGALAILAGGLLHLAIDTLACPGIPLLAPFSDRKYTLGILPGPSLLLAGAAIGALTAAALRLLPAPMALLLYAGTVLAYLGLRAGVFLVADASLPGRKIPLIHPLSWLVVRERDDTCHVGKYTFFRGYSDEAAFVKFRDTDATDIARVLPLPEVRRMVYSSYVVTAERIGDVLILADPLREKGYLYYPPKYRRVAVPAGP